MENKCWKDNKNILFWLKETQLANAQTLKDVDDDEGSVFDYSMLYYGGLEKSLWRWRIIPAHTKVQLYAFVISDEPAVRISYTIEL